VEAGVDTLVSDSVMTEATVSFLHWPFTSSEKPSSAHIVLSSSTAVK
jgi:hypothetical protein